MAADPERHRRAERTHNRAAASHERAAAFYDAAGSPRKADSERERGAKELAGAQIERDRYDQEVTFAQSLRDSPDRSFSCSELSPLERSRRLREASAALRRKSKLIRQDSEAAPMPSRSTQCKSVGSAIAPAERRSDFCGAPSDRVTGLLLLPWRSRRAWLQNVNLLTCR